ncbi:TIGR00282 family metallophosphoesterase [Mycoplasmopsis felifaucium]|uniref:TIGR00282 family metallophosphoesterase n=1 Tax=Mycoplasmopsis felifaucium TaxID=35768 RepID=UPI0004872BDA|nr:TIGR00282 family metallophosphoesterase [Mycoplasmopsis felifaucium]
MQVENKIRTEKTLNILFLGDIFGSSGIKIVKKYLPELRKKHNIDVVIAQSENVSGRKGLNRSDYEKLKSAGVDIFTLGNHVWAKDDILSIINKNELVRPANIDNSYPGSGSNVFYLKNDISLRVTSLMGITFNKLLKPWGQETADSFFDTIDSIIEFKEKTDFHFVDFHAETTSEKYVLGLYLDGKIDAICGTHTHVQTNDAHVLPKGTCYLTDAGMCGPYDCAIGANFDEVYEHMRYNAQKKFLTSKNPSQLNGAVIKLHTNKKLNSIKLINIRPY